ncbi:MAG: flagellar motor protein MotD [Gammaproteobacteria bacterium]|nr:MAG: flagellar motor protein MotD [Gammaproteobacteria bacterium]
MARKRKHEEHVNHERWLVSYADFITLLFAFFVVMYAISSLNQGKYRVLADSLVAAFRSAPKSMVPIQAGAPDRAAPSQSPQHDSRTITVPNSQEPHSLAPFNTQRVPSKTPTRESSNQPFTKQAHAGEQDLPRIAGQIEQAMAPLIERQLVAVRRDDKQRWLEVEIKSSILFGSGSARMEREALPVLERLGAIMSQFTNPIEVRGYTDNKPINSQLFPSNWELSAARAASVVHLLTEFGVAPERLAAIGYGEYQPLADNETELGRSQNRRVSLLILADDTLQRSLQAEHPELIQPEARRETPPPSGIAAAPETAAPVAEDKGGVNTAPPATVISPASIPDETRRVTAGVPVPAASSPAKHDPVGSAPAVAIVPETPAAPVAESVQQQAAPPDVRVNTPYTAVETSVPEVIYQAPAETGAAVRPADAPAPPVAARRMIPGIAPPIQLAPPVQLNLPMPAPVSAVRPRQQEAH